MAKGRLSVLEHRDPKGQGASSKKAPHFAQFLPYGYVSWSTEGRIQRVNQPLVDLFESLEDRLVGADFREQVHSQDRSLATRHLPLGSTVLPQPVELRLISRRGRIVVALVAPFWEQGTWSAFVIPLAESEGRLDRAQLERMIRSVSSSSSMDELVEDHMNQRLAELPGELTAREREVLRDFLRGFESRTMAERLGLSVHTIRNHLKSICAKLDVHSQAALRELFACES